MLPDRVLNLRAGSPTDCATRPGSNDCIESSDVSDVKVNHGSLLSDWTWRHHEDIDAVPKLAEKNCT